jgi:hypothetical protein
MPEKNKVIFRVEQYDYWAKIDSITYLCLEIVFKLICAWDPADYPFNRKEYGNT